MACSRVRLPSRNCGGLPVAQRRERRRVAVAGKQVSRLFNQALGEHGSGPGIDALIELRALWIQAEAEYAITGQGFPAFLPGF